MGEKYRSSMSSFLVVHSRDIRFLIIGAVLALATLYFSNQLSVEFSNQKKSNAQESSLTPNFRATNGNTASEKLPIPMIDFPEPAWRTPSTLNVRTVTSTPFARFEIHQVKTESGEIINDWLWTDERSHVNILVHLKDQDKYMMFYQKKYGLSKPHYATIGGLFNVGDTPEGCARRELLEETGLEAGELIYLGAYRVQVNRGGGILHAYYAKNCVKAKTSKKSDDYETQEVKLLTKEELLKQVLSHNIGEAQWLATVATGILYDDYKQLATAAAQVAP